MPELPDITAYIAALEPRILGQTIEHVRLASPFLLRTVDPPPGEAEGKTVRELRRIGKRIAIGVEKDLWLVLHLMIAGRLHWRPPQAKLAGRNALLALDFSAGSLSSQKRDRNAALRCTSFGARRVCVHSIRAASKSFLRTWENFARRSAWKTAP